MVYKKLVYCAADDDDEILEIIAEMSDATHWFLRR